ncbi:hypothetical protein HDV05_008757 [Chytridiales sp. JEL 0842]|nr:hypothetical protein HDV05_008757 [Chytridiales sp. JEL 0842]
MQSSASTNPDALLQAKRQMDELTQALNSMDVHNSSSASTLTSATTAKDSGVLMSARSSDGISLENGVKVKARSSSFGTSQNPSTLNEKNVELPPYWGRKTTPQGQIYYFNTQTNQTTYNLDEVMKSMKTTRRSTLLLMEGQKLAFDPNSSLSTVTESPTPLARKPRKRNISAWMRRSSLLVPDAKITWELVISNILQSISELNKSITESKKDLLIDNTNRVVGAIRDMMLASGTMSKDAPILGNNTALKSFHNHIMTSLSKLVITSKVASGQWPPPDAVDTLRFHVGQVLLAVRNFVAQAQQLNLELNTKPPAGGVTEFVLQGVEMSDQELLGKLDEYSDTIFKSIGKLVGLIQKSNRVSGSIIDQARSTVTFIGELMSLIEDIKLSDAEVTNPEILQQFLGLKEQTYNVVNGLISSAMATMDEFAPPNSLNAVLEFTSHVFECVEDLVLTTKLLLDQMELQEQIGMQDKAEDQGGAGVGVGEKKRDSELSMLQRRALSLTLMPTKNNVAGRGRAVTVEGVPNSVTGGGGAASMDLSVRRPSTTAFEPERMRTYSGNDGFQPMIQQTMNMGPKSAPVTGPVQTIGSLSDIGKPWYLKYDYTPDSISLNNDGKINGGLLPSLVERLTIHDLPQDPEFASTFLMMFHAFTSARELLTLFINRYLLKSPPQISHEDYKVWLEKKLTPIRLRVFNTLKLWLESYWVEEYDSNVLNDILVFAQGPLSEFQPSIAPRLISLVQSKLNGMAQGPQGSTTYRPPRRVNNGEAPPAIIPKVAVQKLTLMDIDPLEVARQLTLLQTRLFCGIHPMELIGQAWSKKGGVAPNVRGMTDLSNKITSWAVFNILNESDVRGRANMIKTFVKICDRLIFLQNFDGAMALLSAFNSSTVSRLRRTWGIVSSKTMTMLDNVKKVTDNAKNYSVYRAKIRTIEPPCIPFLGLYLTDLTFTSDGNPDIRYINGMSLINFDKYMKLYRLITDLQRFQMPYALYEIPEITDWLMERIQLASATDSEALYELSLHLEPRRTEEEHAALHMEDRMKEMGFL